MLPVLLHNKSFSVTWNLQIPIFQIHFCELILLLSVFKAENKLTSVFFDGPILSMKPVQQYPISYFLEKTV